MPYRKKFVTYNNIYISRKAILHNFDHFGTQPTAQFVIPVLKANAYGHGLEQIATILKDRILPYIAVDGYFEALQIQQVSKQPILVMGAINPLNFRNMRLACCAFVVHDQQTVQALAATNKKVAVHLELETGMGRHGVPLAELDSFLNLLKQSPKLQLEGVMTHLADADNPVTDSYTEQQTTRFDKAVKQIRSNGFKPKYIHIAQTAGSIKVHSKTANALRVGIGLYGLNPLAATDAQSSVLADLQPALTLTSTIAKVVELAKGETLSYGRTFTAKKPTKIGVLPLGYYEGLPRSLSNVGVVQHGADYLPIAGRICMNHTMINLTGTSAKQGDMVTVISANSADKNSVARLAADFNLFNYSLLTSLNPTIRRTIID